MALGSFGAFAIHHAWNIWVKNATGTMDHVLDYQVIELRLCVRIRELCRLMSSGVLSLESWWRNMMRCMCGKPLFWNSIVKT
jgi:hypothetical protein